MNPLDDQLDCLLRAARRGAQGTDSPSSAPFGLETRVLAAWRSTHSAGSWNTALLTRGALLAGAIMVACLWPALNPVTKTTPDIEYLQLADSSLPVDNP